MTDSIGDSAPRLLRHSNPRLPAQEFNVGDRVHIASEPQPQTYEVTEARIKKDERLWTYALKEEGSNDTKWVEENQLQRT